MEKLRVVKNLALNKGDLMANGLFNVTDSDLLETTKDKGVSLWFDEETKNELMEMSDAEFVKECEELFNQTI